MKILVTGGAGYLGTHVRRFFGADDLSRTSGLDILSLQDVTVVADYDVVIHMAALLDKSPENAGSVFLTNVEGTVNLLREMRQDSIFIFASTKDVYGRFADNFSAVPETCPTIYAGQSALEWSKLIAERYIEYYANARGFRSCILRMSTVYAPPTERTTPNFVGYYADAINKGEAISLAAGGRSRRDILHVDDLSAAMLAFMESVIRHGLYNVGGGPANTFTLAGLVAKLEEISGLQAVIKDDTELPKPTPMNYVSDLSLIQQELDWSPKIRASVGLSTLFSSTPPE